MSIEIRIITETAEQARAELARLLGGEQVTHAVAEAPQVVLHNILAPAPAERASRAPRRAADKPAPEKTVEDQTSKGTPEENPPSTSQKTEPAASTEPTTAPDAASASGSQPAVDAGALRAEIRQVLSPLMRDPDKAAAVNALIAEHGATSLSKVADDQLASLLSKAKEM